MKPDYILINGIAETMLLVFPISFFQKAFHHIENRRTFYEMVCNRACLNKKSLDVMIAFEHAIKKAHKTNKGGGVR